MQDLGTQDLQVVLETLRSQRDSEISLLKWLIGGAGVGVAAAFATIWRAHSALVARLEDILETVGGEKRPRKGGRRGSDR